MGATKDALGRIYDQLTRKKQAVETQRGRDLRTLVRLIGDSEDGSNVDIDVDFFQEVVETADFSMEDIKKSVEVYKARKRDHLLAARAEGLRKSAKDAEQAFREADLAEGRRRREAIEKLNRLEDSERAAISESGRALEAIDNLRSTARVTEAEKQLIAKQVEINLLIKTEEQAIDPNFTRYSAATGGGAVEEVGGTYWPHLDRYPAALAKQTRLHIDRKNTGYSKDRIAQLKSQTKTAEVEVKRREKILSDLVKQRAQINAELEQFTERKLLPEEFQLQRAKPTHIERTKATARQLGVGSQPPLPVGK